MDLEYAWRAEVDDMAVELLHAAAFGHEPAEYRWKEQLSHCLGWVTARAAERLVGFVNVAWDGGAHAFIIDTVVHPEFQRNGIGLALVQRSVEESRKAGCEWLHVDFEPDLEAFYLGACGFKRTDAGLLRL